MERTFTRQQLIRFDGDQELEIYIAYDGIVYDVTDCPKWRTGLHEGQHFGGQDLTEDLSAAPHLAEVFQHDCLKIVGRGPSECAYCLT